MNKEDTKQAILGFAEFFKGITGNQDLKIPDNIAKKYEIEPNRWIPVSERLSIDEAIKDAEKVAEENQRIVDTGIVFDDVTIDMLYCDDTEVIEEHLANYQSCAKKHRQLAEWLKDYKRLLEQTCEDAISRKAAIAETYRDCTYVKSDKDAYEQLQCIRDGINKLPSVQPKPTECENAISRNLIIETLNKMDRYVADELTLCDTDKKFPHNEVFIVDDVYEQIVEQLPSVNPQPKTEWIPVSERLPEEGQSILVTTTNGWHVVAIIRTFLKDVHKDIIAWMPLPEPYNPQESEE